MLEFACLNEHVEEKNKKKLKKNLSVNIDCRLLEAEGILEIL